MNSDFFVAISSLSMVNYKEMRFQQKLFRHFLYYNKVFKCFLCYCEKKMKSHYLSEKEKALQTTVMLSQLSTPNSFKIVFLIPVLITVM